MAWESLKRILFSGEIRIESLERLLWARKHHELPARPIPVSVKVRATGDRNAVITLLFHYDLNSSTCSRSEGDFEDDIDRHDDSYGLYARMIAHYGTEAEMRPLGANRGGKAD